MPNFESIAKADAPGKPAPAVAQTTRRKAIASKRTTRKLVGSYLTPETVAKLKRHVLDRQEAGDKIDASDVVEQALVAFLG